MIKEFTLKIATEGAAFKSDGFDGIPSDNEAAKIEVATILRRTADDICPLDFYGDSMSVTDKNENTVHDVNGNRVGEWKFNCDFE